MDFASPQDNDYQNVRSLNRGFLALAAAIDGPPGFSTSLRKSLGALSQPQLSRLAETPFLLFSLRERDDQYWQYLLSTGRDRDLFDDASAACDGYRPLVCASLGFLWQLARTNPYSVRLICGASLHWCESIGELSLFRLLRVASTRTDMLQTRFPAESNLWTKLLHAGVQREVAEREAAQLSALQMVLAAAEDAAEGSWNIAACRRRGPRLRIAED